MYFFNHIQKEIQNDEDSQTSSGWTKYSNQEESKDFKKDSGSLEMKAAGESMYRIQVKFYELNIL